MDYRYRKKLAYNGLCPCCGKPSEGNTVECDSCNNRHKDKLRELRNSRKSQNLCAICGNPMDREGYYCCKCNDERREKLRGYRQSYIDVGLCPECRIHPIMGDERQCLECRAKKSERAYQLYHQNTEEQREKNRIAKRKQIQSRRERNVCLNCGGEKEDESKSLCFRCARKSAERMKRYRLSNPKPRVKEQRIKEGKCIYCDNPKKLGYAMCEQHRAFFGEIARRNGAGRRNASM